MAQVILPGGIAVGGQWQRRAVLRPLAGNDEAFLVEDGAGLSPAARSSELLARCLESLGPLSPVDRAAVRELAVGDREALFLHLRRLTFGERISCVLECPEPSCGAKMDLDLTVSELLQPAYADAAAVYETMVDGPAARYRVRFRLPNGGDQEEAAALAATDIAAAADLILHRTIREITDHDANTAVEEVPPAVKEALPARMAEIDRQAEIVLKLDCPECERLFTVPFDAADYFQRELSAQLPGLYREVHLLAFHYHWSEAEILGMSARKRRMYLNLLASEIGERG
jgi:hypothetical protein